MTNLADYFEERRYKPKYFLGDRVFGRWNKIPFIGSVGNDTVISELEGPRISILVDLPIWYDEKAHSVIIVKHKDIKPLKDFSDEENEQKSRKARVSEEKLPEKTRKSRNT